MGVNKKKKPKLNLAAGRPPSVQRPKSISRKATRTLINQIHTLEKRRKQAAQNGDAATEAAVASEIASLGGIEKYQQASLQGQRNDRGGDSSKILLDWLKPLELTEASADPDSPRRLRMLEVGALSTTNACSLSGLFDIVRIDLNSQAEGILQQDFMERPLPRNESERFDIISLSLVLNFVPEAGGRGDMLLRTLEFLHPPSRFRDGTNAGLKPHFPSLFLVLPAPCVSNSRYLDGEKLNAIMSSLGYQVTKSKTTQKLVYYLWTRDVDSPPLLRTGASFTKKELRSGASRNNFAIVLKARSE
ncbi:25S rRNA (adenine2142-N1)-methyltransferase [Diaporthe australafricana]|uniref:25S rRNA adenine-N(1) methyltransferase n=1 Tax=Diaporthe australafricana TaxID=127596 RepID=A0ABR3XXA4_9PEZI